MGKRKKYESPYIRRSQIETESGFCAASIIDGHDKNVVSSGQEEGTVKSTEEVWDKDETWF